MPPKAAPTPAPSKPPASTKDEKPEENQTTTATPPEDENVIKKGVFSFADGAMYTGEYRTTNNGVIQRHGHGVYQYGPETYDGQWEGDAMHGRGTFHFASGAVYEGEFQQNVFHGDGKYQWADGAVYTGSWTSGRMHSDHGEYVDKDGVIWRGRFFNGKLDNGRIFHTLR